MINISVCILILVHICLGVRIKSIYVSNMCLQTPWRYLVAASCNNNILTNINLLGDLEKGWWQLRHNEWWSDETHKDFPIGHLSMKILYEGGVYRDGCLAKALNGNLVYFVDGCEGLSKFFVSWIKLTYVETEVKNKTLEGWHIIQPMELKGVLQNPCLTYSEDTKKVYFGDCHEYDGRWDLQEVWLIEDL